jgi:hypothetical protein
LYYVDLVQLDDGIRGDDTHIATYGPYRLSVAHNVRHTLFRYHTALYDARLRVAGSARRIFKDLVPGTIFQVRDGRCPESATWVPLVKVDNENGMARLIVSPIHHTLPGDMLVTTKSMRMLGSDYAPLVNPHHKAAL